MARIWVAPDRVFVTPGAVDVTNVVRQLWNTHQWCIDNGYAVPEDDDPVFEQFRELAGLPTQAEYEADKFARFRAHQEWLIKMQATNWGMTSEEGI